MGIWNANTYIYKKDWRQNKPEWKKVNGRTQSKGRDKKLYPIPWLMEVLIRNQGKNNSKLCDAKKKLEQGSIINEWKEISKVKVNVLLMNSIQKNIKLLDNYIDCIYK